MPFYNPVTQHTFKSNRHTTTYYACGEPSSPLLLFIHGWPELGHSWRHQLPVFAGLGFYCVAPDMRGYGVSGTYIKHEDYRIQDIVQDMIELIEGGLDRIQTVLIGHDWGAPVVWALTALYPEKVMGVAALGVPYFSQGFLLQNMINLVDRDLYPIDQYPVGQWDYQLFHLENFEKGVRDFEANLTNTFKAIFRHGSPSSLSKPSLTASIRENGGWFGGKGQAPDLPIDTQVISEEDLQVYVQAFAKTGFFGADSWYMNHEANQQFFRESGILGKKLELPVLFLHAKYDAVCETVQSKLADPMRQDCLDLTEEIIESGHWMAQEQPLAVNAALVRWLVKKLPGYWSRQGFAPSSAL